MPADLFGAVVARRRSTSRRFGAVPLSVALHAAILVAVVVIPLVATTSELPIPWVPSDRWVPTPVVMVPPAPPSPRPARPPLIVPGGPTIPLVAPNGITPDSGLARVEDNITQMGLDQVEGGIEGIGDLKALEPPPPPAPAPPKVTPPVRVGEVAMPRKIHDVAPIYPPPAVAARIQGTVVIEAIISTAGDVQDARVIKSVPFLDAAALEAVRQWVYTPTRHNGKPVPVILQVKIEFKLQ